MQFKIFMVEDDAVIRQALRKELEKWNYETAEVEDFSKVLERFLAEEPHLVLMDISLPVFNGFYWTQEIRKQSKVPILFLSSRDSDMDVVMAVQMGGDDYVTKPFSMDLLLAKIQALLRRSYDFAQVERSLQVGELRLLQDELSLEYKGKTLELSLTEAQILSLLMESEGQFISRESLCVKLWESNEFIDDNTLSVNMSRIRKKLSPWGIDSWIETKRGVGYRILAGE